MSAGGDEINQLKGQLNQFAKTVDQLVKMVGAIFTIIQPQGGARAPTGDDSEGLPPQWKDELRNNMQGPNFLHRVAPLPEFTGDTSSLPATGPEREREDVNMTWRNHNVVPLPILYDNTLFPQPPTTTTTTYTTMQPIVTAVHLPAPPANLPYAGSQGRADSAGLARPTLGRASKPVMLPKPYDPSSPFEHFHNLFEDAADINGWNDSEKARFLPQVLPAKVYETIASIPSRSLGAYRQMITALIRRFGSSMHVGRNQALFQARRQQPNEDPVAFAQALRTLSGWAYPEMDERSKDGLLKQYFLAGLIDRNLSRWVGGFEPRSFEEAVNKTINLTTNAMVDDGRSKSNRSKPRQQQDDSAPWVARVDEEPAQKSKPKQPEKKKEQTPDKVIEALKKRLTELEKGRASATPKGAQSKGKNPKAAAQSRPASNACYHCGETGHFARECQASTGQQPQRRQFESQYRREGNANATDPMREQAGGSAMDDSQQ